MRTGLGRAVAVGLGAAGVGLGVGLAVGLGVGLGLGLGLVEPLSAPVRRFRIARLPVLATL